MQAPIELYPPSHTHTHTHLLIHKPGSLSAKHPTRSPFKKGFRNFSFCASVAYFCIGPRYKLCEQIWNKFQVNCKLYIYNVCGYFLFVFSLCMYVCVCGGGGCVQACVCVCVHVCVCVCVCACMCACVLYVYVFLFVCLLRLTAGPWTLQTETWKTTTTKKKTPKKKHWNIQSAILRHLRPTRKC